MSRKDPQAYFEKALQERQLLAMDQQIAHGNSQMMDSHQLSDGESVSLVKEQLDLGKDIERIDKLLRGWTLIQTAEGEKWQEPTNEDLIILSEQGLHYFRQILANYVHKGTMLSHYEQEDILQKMHDLANQINDDIFVSYETLFKMPSVERCYKELKKRLDNKAQVKRFARELLGQPINEEEINSQVLKEMEINLEVELAKIKDKLFNDKLKRFSSYLLWVEDLIHSTYQRAYNGAERRTLRQHMQITETTGGLGIQEKKGGILQWRKN